jgi:DNA helicase II / ATP-dependent DNA helicase PcrA
MNLGAQFTIPSISDDDVRWASRQLGLKDDAFFGSDGADPRAVVIKSLEKIDVAACPGSGKTTLLVAKLAILAEKWLHGTQGICVLSHTNVARNEIGTRLGHSTASQRLLNYPHFVGTIHGFINEFLAIPWLQSRGLSIKMIDSDVCQRRRWNSLPIGIRTGLEKNRYSQSVLSAKSPNYEVGELKWGKSTLGKGTPTYKALQMACKNSMTEGFFCYDEMFMWAQDLMNQMPFVIAAIRHRFPLLLIDEAQDNQKEQSAILHRIFTDGNGAVCCQRFGDGNQAIFNSTEAEAASAELAFPATAFRRDLPTSHRFGQVIANFADPLGLIPYNLQGRGPKTGLASGQPEAKHTIFIFNDETGAAQVIPAFAKLLFATFSVDELRTGIFKAVGQVHQDTGDDNFPRHVGHYWRNYDPQLSKSEPRPDCFVQYVFAGVARADVCGETHPCVEKIADGFLRLGSLTTSGSPLPSGRNRHRQVLDLLKNHPEQLAHYRNFVSLFAVDKTILTKEAWEANRATVQNVAEKIANAPLTIAEAQAFLAWKDHSPTLTATAETASRDNIQRFTNDGKTVDIAVASIHSVKGETHTGTLVLETFWHEPNISSIKAWLTGEKIGENAAGTRILNRLKLHYVAMTRPSHLICLAISKSLFFAKEADDGKTLIAKLLKRGWEVQYV